jgi:hypothetical protein
MLGVLVSADAKPYVMLNREARIRERQLRRCMIGGRRSPCSNAPYVAKNGSW